MPANITKKVIAKKIGGTVYSFYPRTSSDIVEFTASDGLTTSNVETVLRDLITKMGSFSENVTNVSGEIQKQVSDAVAMILGTDDKSSIAQAYDTLKEIADILSDNNTDPENPVLGLVSAVTQLRTEVETASTGLLDRTTTLERKVNGYTEQVDDGQGGTTTVTHDGLLTRVSALETFTTNATTDTIPVGPNEDRNYVSSTEKQKIADSAVIRSVASDFSESDMNEVDLYFVDIATSPSAEPTEPSEP